MRYGRKPVGRVKAIVYAVAVHIAVIALLVVGFRWQLHAPSAGTGKQVVQAMTVDDAQVQREVERLRQEEARKRQQEADRLQRLQDEQAKAAAAEKARKAEEARLAELKQQALAEQKRQAAQRAAELKQRQDAQRQAELAKQHEAEAARKAAAVQARRQKEAQAAFAQQLAAEEQSRVAAAQAAEKAAAASRAQAAAQARALTEADRYKVLIKQKVERNWVRPPTVQKGLQCVVRVRLLAGGDVVGAKVIQGSGNAAFDRSVESAVFKAAPLPVPSDPQVFDYFRELDFVFNPQD